MIIIDDEVIFIAGCISIILFSILGIFIHIDRIKNDINDCSSGAAADDINNNKR